MDTDTNERNNNTKDNNTIDDKIAYHKTMEYMANKAGDFTKAEHHRQMQKILKSMKEQQQTISYNDDRDDSEEKV